MNTSRPDPVPTLQLVKERLAVQREHLNNEIKSCPTPIAGCDQQFNYLLDQQRALVTEWTRLLELEREHSEDDLATLLADFVASSEFLKL